MQRCCAEGAPQVKHGVISKVPTVETLEMLGLAIEKQQEERKMLPAGDTIPEQKLQLFCSVSAKTQPCVSIAAFLYATPWV